MPSQTLNDVLVGTLRSLYDTERQLSIALPEIANSVFNSRAREALRAHCDQSQEHLRRLEKIAHIMGFDLGGVHSFGVGGLVKDAQLQVQMFKGNAAGDAAILASVQRCEHFEIDGYGAAMSWGETLKLPEECLEQLELTLQEEEEMDDMLSDIIEDEVNPQAMEEVQSMANRTSLM